MRGGRFRAIGKVGTNEVVGDGDSKTKALDDLASKLLPLIRRKGKRKHSAKDDLKEEVAVLVRRKDRRVRRGKGESTEDLDTKVIEIATTLGDATE
eukprot:1328983-Rhodomonas_salina.1